MPCLENDATFGEERVFVSLFLLSCMKMACASYLRRKFPFNKKQVRVIAGLFICLFSSAFSITMLFPFLPFMVEFLIPSLNPTSVGTYAGFIASSMFAGRFFGSYIWGLIADGWGKRRVIILSELLLGLTSMFFGFSVNIYMACVLRFLVGLSNGIIGTAKAALSEVTTNKTQPLGLAILTSSFGIGIVIGPAVSGAIADPINQYNLTINNAVINDWLTRFPYSLPCIVNLFLCLISVVAAICLIPNTLSDAVVREKDESSDYHSSSVPSLDEEQQEQKEEGEGEGQAAHHDTLSIDSGLDEQQRDLINHEETEKTNITETEDRIGIEYKNTFKRKASYVLSIIPGRRNSASLQFVKLPVAKRRSLTNDNGVIHEDQEEIEMEEIGGDGHTEDGHIEDSLIMKERSPLSRKEKAKNKMMSFRKGVTIALKDLKMFMKDRNTRLALLIYCAFSFVIIGFDELYSLWCSTSVYSGGIGFNLHEIGISLSVVGVILLPFTFSFFPLMEKKLGSIRSFQIMGIMEFFFIVLFPSLHFLVLLNSRVYLWLVMVIVLFIIRLATTAGFAATSLFINNSVTPDKLGAINGLAVSLTSLFRCISPLFVGTIYSASLSKTTQSIGFPVDYHLIFIILGFILLVVVLLTTCLPSSINRIKIRETRL